MLPVLALGVRPKNTFELGAGGGVSESQFTPACGDLHRDARALGLLKLAYERELPWSWMSLHFGVAASAGYVKAWSTSSGIWAKYAEGTVWWYAGELRLDTSFRYAGFGLGVIYNHVIFSKGARNEKDEDNARPFLVPQAWLRIGPRLGYFYLSYNMDHFLNKTILYRVPLLPLVAGFGIGAGVETRLFRARASFNFMRYVSLEGGGRVAEGWRVGTKLLIPLTKTNADNYGLVGLATSSWEF
jgi:hypothetical protein